MESSQSQTTTARERHAPFVALLFIALLIRGGALFTSLDSFNDDPDDYGRLAENLYVYGVFGSGSQATAFRPPLYPWTLKTLAPLQAPSERRRFVKTRDSLSERGYDAQSTARRSFFNNSLELSRNASIALLHWILGLVTVGLVYKLALYANLSPRWAACTGLLVALDPILLQQSRLVMTETLAAFFSAATLLATCACVKRQRTKYSGIAFFFLGVLYGLSTLCRPAFFAFVGLVFLGLVILETRNPKIGAIVRLSAYLLGIACVVAPWLLRNVREFNKPILTTTHGGYTLYLANNPEIYKFYKNSPAWSLWVPEEFHKRRTVEYEQAQTAAQISPNSKEAELFQDDWTKQEALKTISADPQTFLYACRIRIGELWRVLPQDVAQLEPRQRRSTPISQRSLKDYARGAVALFYSWELFFSLLALVGLGTQAIIKTQSINKKYSIGILFKSSPLKDSPILWGLLLILSVQIPHLVYWTNMRMRAPLETFIPILTIIGVAFLCRLILRFRRSPHNQYIPKVEQDISEKNE